MFIQLITVYLKIVLDFCVIEKHLMENGRIRGKKNKFHINLNFEKIGFAILFEFGCITFVNLFLRLFFC